MWWDNASVVAIMFAFSDVFVIGILFIVSVGMWKTFPVLLALISFYTLLLFSCNVLMFYSKVHQSGILKWHVHNLLEQLVVV